MTKAAEIRKKAGVSQSRFAEKFGIPVRTLQQWEQGKSTPPSYVLDLLDYVVESQSDADAADDGLRHCIPPKTSWKVCIDEPFPNCDKVYPIQQHKVREVIDDVTKGGAVRSIWVFGSSVTERCHMGSDVDVFVDSDAEGLLTEPHDFKIDLWMNATADKRLKDEVFTKGVKVYG